MSIMDMFRMGAKAPEPQQQTSNGQQQQVADPSLKADPATPDLNAVPVGIDKFKDLWQPNAKKEGEAPEFNPGAIFNMDPENIAKAVGQINFAEAVKKEDLQAIMAGGEDAMEAFMRSMNSVSAKTMTLATSASAKMIEKAMSDASGAMDGRINKQVKLNQVNSQMQELNPALSHPAAAPLVNALKEQFTNKHPTATAQEIGAMVQEYMVNFTDIAAGKKESPDNAKKAGTDWNAFLSS